MGDKIYDFISRVVIKLHSLVGATLTLLSRSDCIKVNSLDLYIVFYAATKHNKRQLYRSSCVH